MNILDSLNITLGLLNLWAYSKSGHWFNLFAGTLAISYTVLNWLK